MTIKSLQFNYLFAIYITFELGSQSFHVIDFRIARAESLI